MTSQRSGGTKRSRANTAGHACTLTVLTRVAPGNEGSLRDVLAQLNVGRASPVAALADTHFARFIVVDGRVDGFGDAQHLLFDACFDGEPVAYLEMMRAVMSETADRIWMHCVDYPGSTDAAAFLTYFGRNQIDASVFLAAYPHATVQRVRDSLALRQRIIDFAIATQELDAPALLAAYREALG